MTYTNYVNNQQFNLQINRFINDFYESDERVNQDLQSILPNLTSTEKWYSAWNKMAEYRVTTGDLELASVYYQAAEFYLPLADPRKRIAYENYKKLFYKTYKQWRFEYHDVPYGNLSLPAVKLITPNATKTLIVFAGYDSLMEEMVKAMNYLKGIDYNIIVFDGPGQGGALRQGIKLIPEWENPVATIFDYFGIKNAAVMGVSFGGYLAMRAAAYDKRITKVICFDIFYSFFDSLKLSMPKEIFTKISELLNSGDQPKLNKLVYRLMDKNIDFKWKIEKGMENTGATSPYKLLRKFQQYNMDGLGERINQDVLLLAGASDQYVPLNRIYQIQSELINAKTITSKIFNKTSGGDQHCQAGHRELAFNIICQFLNENMA